MNYNDIRITHSEAIERTVDEIVAEITSKNVSSETWLAVKAKILKLLATIAEAEPVEIERQTS